jgi:hypothetical protein
MTSHTTLASNEIKSPAAIVRFALHQYEKRTGIKKPGEPGFSFNR